MSSTAKVVFSSFLAVGLATGAWFFLQGEPFLQEELTNEQFAQASARGTEEDPHARSTYERRRLRDPETGQIPENVRKKELAFAEGLPERLRKSSSWKPRGPVNVGGRSRALAVDDRSTTGDTILAGGVSGGMWRTTDGGSSWTRTFDPAQRPNVTSLAQDPRSGRREVWYAGTGERTNNTASEGGAPYRGDGIYESTDGGQSWTLLSSTSGEETVFDKFFDYTYAVEVDPSATIDALASPGEDSEVYAATYGRINRSTDGGDNWTGVLTSNTGSSYSVRTDVEVTSNGVVYAALSSEGDRSGLFTSTTGDQGSWSDITPSAWPSTYRRTLLAVNPSNENEVWALVKGSGSGPNGHELWKFDRSSVTWTDYTSYLPQRGGRTGTFNSQDGYDLIVEVHPDSSNILFVGGRNLWRIDVSAPASDANTWIGGYTADNNSAAFYNPSGSDPHHPDQHALAFLLSRPDTMYVGSDGGIHRTDNSRAGDTGSSGDKGVLWNDLNNGYFTTQFYSVCQNADADDGVIAGGMQDNATYFTSSVSVTDPWIKEGSGDGGYCDIVNNVTRDGTSHYVSSQEGPVYRNVFDSNGNFVTRSATYPTGASGQLFINPFAIDPANRDVMYYPAADSLWRNTDLENSPSSGWENLSGAAVPQDHVITAVGVSDTTEKSVLYYGTVDTDGNNGVDPGRLYRLKNADTASPTSPDTVEVTGAGFPDGGYVSSIEVHPTDSDRVLVTFSNYNVTSIFYTADAGTTWTDVEGNLEGSSDGFGGTTGPSVRSGAILPQPGLEDTTYYVGTSVGVYSTTSLDGSSTSWTQEGATEIGDVVVDQVQARAEDGRVIVGTHANGTYSISEPLPVELAEFGATASGESVRLTWQTASETNNAGFEVEHKYRDGSFEKLGFVEGAGTSSGSQSYEYAVGDDLPPGPHTFRLRQVDTDGSATYSETREVVLSPSGDFSLTKARPNPFREATTMRLTVSQPQPVEVAVYNTLGQRVQTILDREVQADRPLDLRLEGKALGSGLYVVQVEGESFEATRKAMLVR